MSPFDAAPYDAAPYNDSPETIQILIVEDESIIALDLKEQLESLGYGVVGIVSSGAAAFTTASNLRPDLILMDIVLSGPEDGIIAAARIRQKLGIPIIYVTAYTDSTTLQRARLTSPAGYVTKPVRESDLRASIAMALNPDGTTVDRSAPAPPVADPEDEPRLLEGVSLLVVEGDRVLNDLYVEFFGLLGATVSTSNVLMDAIDLLASTPVAVIISELSLPDGPAQMLLTHVRAREATLGLPPTPLLAVTTQSDPAVLQAAVAAGFADCLVKPANLNVLKTTVARLAGRLNDGGRGT